jgi:hypothetical protein
MLQQVLEEELRQQVGAGRVLEAWAMEQGVQLMFIRPGRPMENWFIESFNVFRKLPCLRVVLSYCGVTSFRLQEFSILPLG